MSLFTRLAKFVQVHPKPFVMLLSGVLMLTGFAGTLLKAVMPLPAFILVAGMAVYVFEPDISKKLRSQEITEMIEDLENLEQIQENEQEVK